MSLVWTKTRSALKQLEELVKCNSCGNLLKEPCSINSCDHSFCRACVTQSVNADSKCPECGSFAWVKNIEVNRQLANVVDFCQSLQSLIDKDVNNDSLREKVEDVNCDADQNVVETELSKKDHAATGQNGVVGIVAEDKIYPIAVNDPTALSKGGKNMNKSRKCSDMQDSTDANSVRTVLLASKRSREEGQENVDRKKDKEISVDDSHKKDCPSWPVSAKKPKKAIRTYGNTSHANIAKKPKLHSLLSKKVSSSDSDFEPTAVNGIESLIGRCESSVKATTVSNKEKEPVVCDDDVISEIDREVFHPKTASTNQGCIDGESNETRDVKSGNRRVTRLRRQVKDAAVGEISDHDLKKISKPKAGKRRNAKTSSEVASKTKKNNSKAASAVKRNKKGETPLHISAIKGKYDDAKDLLENGSDPNVKDFAGWTPLHEACNHGQFEIVQLLLDHGAFIDIPGCEHFTPLHDAIANDRLEVAEFLITKGASLNVRNRQGMLPIDYARSTAAKERIQLAASIAQENIGTRLREASFTATKFARGKPKKILHTGLNCKQKKSLEKCAKSLDAEIFDSFDEQVTHVVTSVDKNNICPRTMKNLLAILTGKWIVSTAWIDECLKQNEWLGEDDYEVSACSEQGIGAPKRARLNAAMQFPALFDGCSFYLSGEFQSTPCKSELLEMINLGGGRLLQREPKVETSHPLITPASPAVMKMMLTSSTDELTSTVVAYHAKPNTAQSHCTQYIIHDKQQSNSDRHKRVCSPILSTATTSWIMDCISSFEIVEVKEL
eukprot:gene3062-3525_t